MTTLLLTDIFPSSNFTAGIVTAEMCRAIRPDPLAIFCVLNRHLSPVPYDDLADVPLKVVVKPNEVGVRAFRGLRWGTAGAFAVETVKRVSVTPRLVREAVEFGRAHRVRRVWAVLQGQTMVRMALPTAKKLGVPLHVQVWDPFHWWHKAHLVDPASAWIDERIFDRTMRAATTCASASWAMADHYRERYGVPGEPIIASLDESWARRPKPLLHSDTEFAIGMAGQFYAVQEWLNLVSALAFAGWRVAGRRVVLRTMGRDAPPGNIPPENLDFLGWRSQADAIRILSEQCDVLYCGYPFDPAMAEVSRLSFPSKLPTYFCAGRPVLFHGPVESSPGEYIARREAGLIAAAPIDAVYNALLQFAEDQALYARLCAASTAAFLADFTVARQRAAVRRFLGLDAVAQRDLVSPGTAEGRTEAG